MKNLNELRKNKKNIPKYINDVLEDAIKKEEELQEWRTVSGCNNLYNFKKKKNNESTLLLENQQWKDAASCRSPEVLQKKMTKYQKQDQQIHNWMNMLNIKTTAALYNKIDSLIEQTTDIRSYIDNPEMKTFSLYKEWVEQNNLFDISKTYISLFSVFKKQKNELIHAVERGETDLTPFNTWNICEFFYDAYEKDLDIAELNIFEIYQVIKNLKDAKNNYFDPYDRGNEWYDKQSDEIKETIKYNMRV